MNPPVLNPPTAPGLFLGNCTGSSATPTYCAPGSTTQILFNNAGAVAGELLQIHRADLRRWDHPGRPAIVDRRPRVKLDEGIQRTWEWLRENEARIRRSLR